MRKLADGNIGGTLSPASPHTGPHYAREEQERLKAILRTRADDQFELDRLFSGNPNIRHQTRQRLEKLLIQSEAAETMAPGLQRDMSKMASVTDEEAKILGLEKLASTAWKRWVGDSFKAGKTGEGARKLKALTGMGPTTLARNLSHNGRVTGDNELARRLKGAVTSHIEARGIGSTYQAGANNPGIGNAPVRLGGKPKTASIAPNVDAWFEKNAHLLRDGAEKAYPELLKAAGPALPTTLNGRVSSLKASVNTAPGAGRTAAQHHLAGGSA